MEKEPTPEFSRRQRLYEEQLEVHKKYVKSRQNIDGSYPLEAMLDNDPRDTSIHSLTGPAHTVINRTRGPKHTKGSSDSEAST